MYDLWNIILFFSVGWFLADISTYLFLKFYKKDIAIKDVKYGLNWQHYYFINKYKE